MITAHHERPMGIAATLGRLGVSGVYDVLCGAVEERPGDQIMLLRFAGVQ